MEYFYEYPFVREAVPGGGLGYSNRSGHDMYYYGDLSFIKSIAVII